MKIKLITAVFFALTLNIYAQSYEELESIAAGAADSIVAATVAGGERLVVSVNHGRGSQLVVLSLRDCVELRRYDHAVPITTVMSLGPEAGSVWGTQGNMLKKWGLLDGAEQFSIVVTDGQEVKGITQDSAGEYIAVWSDQTLAVLRVSGNGAEIIWSELTSYPVSDMAIDSTGGNIYIGGSDGTLVKRTFQGSMDNSFVLEGPIYSLAVDSGRRQLLIAMGRELLRLDIQETIFNRISTLPAYKIQFSRDMSTLAVAGGGKYTILTYPSLRVTNTQNVSGNKFIILPNGSVITYDNNIVALYDKNKNSLAGRIFLFDQGAGFVAPDLSYFGNELFKDAVAEGRINGLIPYVVENRGPDQQAACKNFREALNIVTAPERPRVAPVTPPAAPVTELPQGIEIPEIPGTPTVSRPASPGNATVVVPPVPPVRPEGAGTVAMLEPPQTPPQVSRPEMPQMPTVTRPTLAPGADIPSWVITPNSLPPYSAVRAGTDSSVALTECKKKIREDIARHLMRIMLDVELIKEIPSDEVKKRFLWQVAGSTAHQSSEYVIQTDTWVSPEGQYYLLAQIDEESVNQIYIPVFQDQMNQLRAYGPEEYLKLAPVVWPQ